MIHCRDGRPNWPHYTYSAGGALQHPRSLPLLTGIDSQPKLIVVFKSSSTFKAAGVFN